MASVKTTVLILLLLVCSPLLKAKKLSVAIYDFPPFFILNNGVRPGYCYEIIQHLYTNLGYQVSKVELNFSRALRSVEAQEIDLLCAVNTFNNQNLAVSKQTLASLVFYFWKHKDNPFFYDGVASLQGQRILNISGFNYTSISKAYQNHLEQSENVIALGGEQPLKRAFSMINLGRADIIALDRDNANYIIKQLNLQDTITEAGRIPNSFPAYLGVSENHPMKTQLLELFDREYPKLIESGFVDQVLKKYDVFYNDVTGKISVPLSNCAAGC